jgi:hypothetical protein
MMHVLPLQGSLPAHELLPMQEMRFMPALLDTPEAQDIDPPQFTVQLLPEQVTIP